MDDIVESFREQERERKREREGGKGVSLTESDERYWSGLRLLLPHDMHPRYDSFIRTSFLYIT